VIFVTVGSMFPFDRLIRSVDELVQQGVIEGEIEAQIGDGSYEPKHMPFVRFLSKPEFETRLQRAEMIIAHAGAGTIAQALAYQKPLLVLPRQKKFAEHVNDHQIPTALKFAELSHVLVAHDAHELALQLPHLRAFRPRPREVQALRLAGRIGDFLRDLQR